MAPAPKHGKGIRPLLDQRDLSAFLTDMTVSAVMEPADITTYGDNDRNYIPGLKDATLSLDGIFAKGALAADDIANHFDGAFGNSTGGIWTIDLERSTGGRALMMRADQTAYDVSSPVNDIVSLSVDAQASGGYYGGRMLRPLGAITTTGSGSGVATPGTTSAGGSTGGGIGHFHLVDHSTITTLTNKIQHSTSGSTWADLITFTASTQATVQRSTVSGTVKERLRSTVSTFTGGAGKSATLAVAFTRRGRT